MRHTQEKQALFTSLSCLNVAKLRVHFNLFFFNMEIFRESQLDTLLLTLCNTLKAKPLGINKILHRLRRHPTKTKNHWRVRTGQENYFQKPNLQTTISGNFSVTGLRRLLFKSPLWTLTSCESHTDSRAATGISTWSCHPQHPMLLTGTAHIMGHTGTNP